MKYCNVCQESITDKEYNFSKKHYNTPLCRDHQKEEQKGLTTKENKYREGMIKGRIAETLIEEREKRMFEFAKKRWSI